MGFSSAVIPVFVAFVIVFAFIKRVDIYSVFISGAKKGIDIFVSLLPGIVCLFLMISTLRASGLIDKLESLCAPVLAALGIPKEVFSLCLLSPLSGSGSLAAFDTILEQYGADSYPGRVASVIAGATETTFYAVTVYYSAAGIKKTGYTIPCAVLGDIAGYAAAALSVRLFFAG